jgi:hypothetical protein
MPTLTGFIAWIRAVMGIPAQYLPDSAPVITTAYNVAVSIANLQMASIDMSIYALMVYNLGGDNLVNYAPDISASITDITWTSGTATATTAAPHGFVTGDVVLIAGNAPLAYNSQPGPAQTTLGTPIVVTGASAFTYVVSANPGAFAQGGTASETFFVGLRTKFNTGGFMAGVISASNDESTGQSILNPEFMKTLTLGNLQNLKTPWGRQYLAFAQDFGEMWGIS